MIAVITDPDDRLMFIESGTDMRFIVGKRIRNGRPEPPDGKV